jgi:hemerythrin
MSDNLEVIRLIIEFHHTIRSQIQQISGSINDLEALFSVRSEFAGWSQTSLDKLEERKGTLQQTLALLENGLGKHFQYEEKNLSPILGNIMMKGLMVEHDSIRQEIASVKDIVLNTRMEGLERDEVTLRKSRFQTVLSSLAQHIEKHASREEIVLDMALEGLENR